MSKGRQYCSVFGCNSRRKNDSDVSFHLFPKEGKCIVKIINVYGVEEKIDAQKAWSLKLRIGKQVTKNMCVCSKHFDTNDFYLAGFQAKRRVLKRTAVPSRNLPIVPSRGSSSCRKSPSKVQRQAALRISRLAKRNLIKKDIIKYHQHEEQRSYDENEQNAAYSLLALNSCNEEPPQETENLQSHLLESVPPTKCDRGIQVKSADIVTPFILNIKSDKSLNVFTGLPSFLYLDFLCKLLEPLVDDKRVRKLSIKERIILTLIKLKQNFSFTVLAILFSTITSTTCRTIFEETIHFLAAVLKPLAVRWPHISETKRNIPTCFADFPDVVVVADCTEIFMQTPKCALCKLKLYSHYKSSITAKFMVGVTPAGMICFVSAGYGGRASDKAIFEQSSLLDKIEKGQAIMVDKGFLIDDACHRKGVKVIRPPFLRNQSQFSQDDALLSRKIASARLHVERVNQRLKTFQILSQKYPVSLLSVIDKVFVVICGITNISSPILNDEKFCS